ncbi:MAG: hypothetical protein AB7V32_03680 [Candidatus Berkiella sp.]
MKSDELSFRKAASKGLVGNLKAIYILNPEVLHSTGKTSGKNALAFAVDYQQKEAVRWLMAVGAQPTDPTEVGSLESFLHKEKLTLKPQEDQITIDDLPLFINNALKGLDFLQQKYGNKKDVFTDQDIEFKRVVDNVRRTINRFYLDKDESSIGPLYIFVNYLQKYFQYNIKKIADSIPV